MEDAFTCKRIQIREAFNLNNQEQDESRGECGRVEMKEEGGGEVGGRRNKEEKAYEVISLLGQNIFLCSLTLNHR